MVTTVNEINEVEIYKLFARIARAMNPPTDKPWLDIRAFTVDYNDVVNYGNLGREGCSYCNSTFYSQLWEDQLDETNVVWDAPVLILTPLSTTQEQYKPKSQPSKVCFEFSFWILDFMKDTCEICPKDGRYSRTTPEIWSDLRSMFMKFLFEVQKNQFAIDSSPNRNFDLQISNIVTTNYDHFGAHLMAGLNVNLKLCIEMPCSEGVFDYSKSCVPKTDVGCGCE